MSTAQPPFPSDRCWKCGSVEVHAKMLDGRRFCPFCFKEAFAWWETTNWRLRNWNRWTKEPRESETNELEATAPIDPWSVRIQED